MFQILIDLFTNSSLRGYIVVAVVTALVVGVAPVVGWYKASQRAWSLEREVTSMKIAVTKMQHLLDTETRDLKLCRVGIIKLAHAADARYSRCRLDVIACKEAYERKLKVEIEKRVQVIKLQVSKLKKKARERVDSLCRSAVDEVECLTRALQRSGMHQGRPHTVPNGNPRR